MTLHKRCRCTPAFRASDYVEQHMNTFRAHIPFSTFLDRWLQCRHNVYMRIIKPGTIRTYWRRHPAAQASLEEWLVRTRAGQWNTLIDLRKTFPSADAVRVASGRSVIVFNIAGNRYRLVTAIHFHTKLVYVLLFLTHAAYSQDTWKDHL